MSPRHVGVILKGDATDAEFCDLDGSAGIRPDLDVLKEAVLDGVAGGSEKQLF